VDHITYIITGYILSCLSIFLWFGYHYWQTLWRKQHELSVEIFENTLRLEVLTTQSYDYVAGPVYTKEDADYYLRSRTQFILKNIWISLLWPHYLIGRIIYRKFYRIIQPILLHFWCSKEERKIVKENRVQIALGTKKIRHNSWD